MKGWKTRTAAVLAILYGVAGALLGLHDWDAAMGFAINGLGLVGLGHKIDRGHYAQSAPARPR
jgi:hypothetical protein